MEIYTTDDMDERELADFDAAFNELILKQREEARRKKEWEAMKPEFDAYMKEKNAGKSRKPGGRAREQIGYDDWD